MTKLRFLVIPVIIIILVFGMTSNLNPVLADDPPPALPSSFYGEIQYASSTPIIGDFVEAYVPGVATYVVRDAIESYPTDKLVYALSIPGDNLLTPGKDGGLEGDEVTFKINDRIVALGTWHSGTNIRLDIHPPHANSGGPYVGVTGETVSFNASATDMFLTDTFTYAWDLDDDDEYDDAAVYNPTLSITEGVKTVGVKVTDSQGGEGTATTNVFGVTPLGLTGQTYDGTPKSVLVNGTLYGYAVTYNGSATPPTNAGSYTVVITIYADGSHTNIAGTITRTMVIGKAEQTITVTTSAPATAAFNTNFTVVSTALGGAVVYSSGNTSICTNSGATFTMKSIPGTCVVQYDQGGSTNYNAAPRVTEYTVTPNQPPVVTDIPNQTVAEGANFVTISLDGYVSDADNTDAEMTWTYSGNLQLTVSISSRVATITIPNTDWYGAETITFKATDPGGLFDDDAAVFTVTNTNDAPVITEGASVSRTISEDGTPTAFALTLNATDVDSATLTWSIQTQGAHGTATATGTGASKPITYAPVANYVGTDSFVVRVSDGTLTDSITVNVTISSVNDTPVVTDIPNQTVAEGANFVTISLDGYVSDADNTDAEMTWTYSGNLQLTVSISSRVATITIPNTDWYGAETITFKATDPGGLFDDDAAVFTVTNTNDAPVITEGASVSRTISEDGTPTAFALTLNATDVDSATLTWSIQTQGAHGTATATGTGASKPITYVPVANYVGTDSFVVQVSDGTLTDTITVNVTLTAVPDAPVITEGDSVSRTISEDGTPTAFALTLNATDVDSATLTWSIQTQGAHGTATATGTGASKPITYVPVANYVGTDSFVVRVSDGTLTDSITVNVTISSVNDTPVVTDIPNQTVAEGANFVTISLDGYVSDADNTDAEMTWTYSGNLQLTVSISSRVATITIPNTDWYGAETITFKATDPGGLFDDDAAVFTVTNTNDAPVITEGASVSRTISEDGTPTAFALTLNATDVDSATLTWSIQTQGAHGTATATGTGASKPITYVPVANYVGTDSFVVQVSDGTLTDTITVNVTLTAVPDAPVITEGDSVSRTISEDGTPTAFALTLNATDVDSATLTWSIQTQGAHGTATATGTGASKPITYVPVANYVGTDSFVVRVSDGTLTDSITVNVTIDSVNDAPVAVDDSYSTALNNPLVVTGTQLKANDTDVDNTNAQLSVTAVSNATNGTVQLVGDTVTFTPGSVGTGGFDYTVSDGTKTDTGHVTVTVSAATSFLLTVTKEGPGTGTVTSAPAGISCGSDCSENYSVSTLVTLTATPEPGSAFSGWSGACSGTGTCQVTMDAVKSVTATFLVKHSIALVPGWNLVSFDLVPSSAVTADVLESIDGKYDLVYAWDATGASAGSGNWRTYDPDLVIPQTLSALTNDVGFWINMTEAGTLDVVGTPPATTNVSLLTTAGGWNLVGYPSAVSETLPDALTNYGVGTANYSLVYAYHPLDTDDEWKMFDPTAYSSDPYANDLNSLDPGWGFWIKVTANDIWVVEYNTP